MRDILYAPWRSEYTAGVKYDGCVFCDIAKDKHLDDKLHVLYRDEICFVVMNRYPYTPGHFMIIPNEHTDKLESISLESWQHISTLTYKGVKMLKEGFGASGVNIGMNLGLDAGAGIAEHIHMHLVPRWSRDTNFITTIAQTRVYSRDFEKIYLKLRELIPSYF